MRLVDYAKTIGFRSLDLSRWFTNKELEHPNPLIRLSKALLNSDGEYSALLLAEEFVMHYQASSIEQRTEFHQYLAHELNHDNYALIQAAQDHKQHNSGASLRQVWRSMSSARLKLFRGINLAPGGINTLIALRAEILDQIKHGVDATALQKIDTDLLRLFRDWFNRGFLRMREINWDSPASLLEKVINYEAVHSISSWRELRARLLPEDRLCFAFFHPCLPDEPLVFIELALCNALPTNIVDILKPSQELKSQQATHAIFYSISNCHLGLTGVSFGNFLIKQSVVHLQQQLPNICHFATLSPVPSLGAWLGKQRPELQQNLLEATSYYMQYVKNKSGFPADPVARFHLKNGAELNRIVTNANNSERGISESQSVMVSYAYTPGKLAQNHEQYMQTKSVICTSELSELAGRFQAKLMREPANESD